MVGWQILYLDAGCLLRRRGGIYLSLAVTTRCVLRTQSECSQVVLASLQLSWGSADLLSQRDWGTVSGVQCGAQSGAQSGACKIIIIKLYISHQFFFYK